MSNPTGGVGGASGGMPFPGTPQIIFDNWREALHGIGLSPGVQGV